MAKGVVRRPDDHHLAELRSERDRRLQDSDWTQLPDNIERLGVVYAAWTVYRQHCREVVSDFKKGINTPWPSPPS